MAFLGKSKAVAFKLKHDIDNVLHIVNILVSIFFICYYGYSIYTNINNTIFLVINIIFLVLGLFGFILYLSTHKNKTKITKNIKKIIGKSKYLTKIVVLIINTIQFVKYGGSDLSLILLALSGLILVLQTLVEVIQKFVTNYVELFVEAIYQDFEFLVKLGKLKEAKGNFYEMIDAPLEKLANKLEGKEKEVQLTKTQQELNSIVDTYSPKIEENDRKKKELKKQRIKESSEQRAIKQKEEIKEHLKTIKNRVFKKKEKVE